MFKSGQPNPYDDIVAKTTDENLTGENWELILNLCDKVQDEGDQGARNVIAAILKRLTHRTSNVQLYTLTLAESLTKNCGIEVHREISSRAFTQGLEKLITDRNTHEKVRRRALELIAEWTGDFEKDPSLGIMEECYENLKSKGYKFDAPNEPPPPAVDDEIRRREEEELQRVLELSMNDKGGRTQWSQYSLAQSNGAGGSASGSQAYSAPSAAPATSSSPAPAPAQPTYGGYVPSASPAVSADNTAGPTPAPTRSYSVDVSASPAPSVRSTDSSTPIVTRVRALHTFEASEQGELAFEKGDIIKVVDRGYKDWWRGQLKGRTGIFPVNYVEPLPEPTAAEIAREAEKEAAVFSEAANVDRLLTMLRQMDPAKDNLADNEEIQELYRSCMGLRPKIVKLIDKYSQKRADLVTMNETFVKARTIFDRMMEDSLARHTAAAAAYDRPAYGQAPYPNRVESYGPPPNAYAWNGGYSGYGGPPPTGPYPPGPEQGYGAPPSHPPYGESAPYQGPPQPYGEGAPYQGPPPQQYGENPQYQQPPQQGSYPPQPYGAPPQTPAAYGAPPQPYAAATPTPQPAAQQIQPLQPQPVSPHLEAIPAPQQQQQPALAQVQPQLQAQIAAQQPPAQPQSEQQPQAQPQVQPQAQPQQQTASLPPSGPPYIYDPNTTYPDPNVQAWAQYYVQGGTDPTGAVYFVSVPGVKEPTGSPPPAAAEPTQYANTAPLSLQRGGANTQPSSPSAQHHVPQSFYPADNNTSSSSLPPAQGGQVPYGASPYPAPAGAPGYGPPAGEPPAWQGQYNNLPGQLAGLHVAEGQGHQTGVGAPSG